MSLKSKLDIIVHYVNLHYFAIFLTNILKARERSHIQDMLEVPEIPYHGGPIRKEDFGTQAVAFLASGYALMALFFVQQMASKESKQNTIFMELFMAVLSSILLGGGFLLLALWAGLYV